MRSDVHPEHDDLAEWIGRPFDPEVFDRAAADARLRSLARRDRP